MWNWNLSRKAATTVAAEQADCVAPRPEPVPVATEIVAWRAWSLVGSSVEGGWNDNRGWCLTSINVGTLWTGPTLTASEVPRPQTRHGIYARMSREALGEYLRHPVIGEVALSGIVLEGVSGYRAERATIRSLYLDPAFVPPAPAFGMGRPLCPLEAQVAIIADLEARYQVAVGVSANPHEGPAPSLALFNQQQQSAWLLGVQGQAALFNQQQQQGQAALFNQQLQGNSQGITIGTDHYGYFGRQSL